VYVSFPQSFIWSNTPPQFCGGNVQLNTNTGTGYTYQWYLFGSPLPGATLSSLSATAPGSYTVSVTNPTGCTTISAPFAVSNSTINNLSINAGWTNFFLPE
jgi:hypothetical protein